MLRRAHLQIRQPCPQAVKASVEANGFDRYMPAHGFEAPDYCLLFIATVAVGAWWLAGSVAGGRRPIVYVRGEEGIHRMYN